MVGIIEEVFGMEGNEGSSIGAEGTTEDVFGKKEELEEYEGDE